MLTVPTGLPERAHERHKVSCDMVDHHGRDEYVFYLISVKYSYSLIVSLGMDSAIIGNPLESE